MSVRWRLENAAAVKGDAAPIARVVHPNRCSPILDRCFLSLRGKVSGIGQIKNGRIPVNPGREVREDPLSLIAARLSQARAARLLLVRPLCQ